jgi:hypothetical protein
MRKYRRGALIGILGIAAIFPLSAAAADMIVVESNVPNYPIGMAIKDGTNPELPPGGRVKVLLLPSNETKVFGEGANARHCPVGGPRGACE